MHEDAGHRRRRRMLLLRESAALPTVAAVIPDAPQVPVAHLAEASRESPAEEMLCMEDELFAACRGNGNVSICVEDLARRLLREQLLDRPVLTIGQGPENDLWLNHERILPRHMLLAWLNGSLFFMALSSKAQVQGPKGPVTSGWWTPNLTLRVGTFRLRLNGLRKPPPEFDPLAVSRSLETELPRLELRFLGAASPKRPWSINRPLTLIGRKSVCKIRLDHPQIQPVQAVLLRMAGALWLVNLGRPEQTRVNETPVASVKLDIGDVLQFGKFQVEVQAASEWPSAADSAAELKTSSAEMPTAEVNNLVRQLADQHQKLLETHRQTLRDLERLASQTTDPNQLSTIQELIQKTYLAVGERSASLPPGTLPNQGDRS